MNHFISWTDVRIYDLIELIWVSEWPKNATSMWYMKVFIVSSSYSSVWRIVIAWNKRFRSLSRKRRHSHIGMLCDEIILPLIYVAAFLESFTVSVIRWLLCCFIKSCLCSRLNIYLWRSQIHWMIFKMQYWCHFK